MQEEWVLGGSEGQRGRGTERDLRLSLSVSISLSPMMRMMRTCAKIEFIGQRTMTQELRHNKSPVFLMIRSSEGKSMK